MTTTITFTYYPEIDGQDEEVEAELPSKLEVCSRCEGHGTHMRASMAEHAYTAEEFEESFDDEGREEYFKRGGIYDVTCEECKGLRVVPTVDERACNTPALKALLTAYEKKMRDDADFARECRHEREMGY